MNKFPRLIKASIIIPVYNNPDGLRKVLGSLVAQDFPKEQYEIIVADNYSKDGSIDVAHEYKQNYPDLVKFVIQDKIQSSYAARNEGIKIAKGDILAFTDSDCVPDKCWLMEGCKSLTENNVSMVAGEIAFTFKNSEPNIWEYFDASKKLNQKAYVENAGFGTTANLFVKKSMFDKYGLFIPILKSGGDYEFGRRLTQSGEGLLFAENAMVNHPARSCYRSKFSKSKRIAEGQKMLAKMGLLYHGRLNWRQLLFTINYPNLPGIRMKTHRKILLVLINNYFRYYNFFKRLQL